LGQDGEEIEKASGPARCNLACCCNEDIELYTQPMSDPLQADHRWIPTPAFNLSNVSTINAGSIAKLFLAQSQGFSMLPDCRAYRSSYIQVCIRS
jgi:hypothetical protein